MEVGAPTGIGPQHTVEVREGASDHKGQRGVAQFVGHTPQGEPVYRVIFGPAGFERSAKFRFSDLAFEIGGQKVRRVW